ncbi:MAG TPA: hypothetical protein VGM27_25225, partial [Acidobacteriaceae bacterium]
RDKFREWTEAWAEAFSDGRIMNPGYIDAGDIVVAQFTAVGTLSSYSAWEPSFAGSSGLEGLGMCCGSNRTRTITTHEHHTDSAGFSLGSSATTTFLQSLLISNLAGDAVLRTMGSHGVILRSIELA